MPENTPTAAEPKPGYDLKVNGIQIRTNHQTLTAGAILILALEHHAIVGKPEQYLLQGTKRTYGPDEVVDLLQDDQFIAVPNKPTPVARLLGPVGRPASAHRSYPDCPRLLGVG